MTTASKLFSRRKDFLFMKKNIFLRVNKYFFHENNSQLVVFFRIFVRKTGFYSIFASR